MIDVNPRDGDTVYCNAGEVVAWLMAFAAVIVFFAGAISYLIYRYVCFLI